MSSFSISAARFSDGDRLVPRRVVADPVGRLGGEVRLDVGEPERLPDLQGEAKDFEDLVVDLLRGADDVRVVLREAAHAQETVQDAGLLVAVHGAQLGPAQRKVAVGALLVLVDHEVERAVHRLEEVVHVVDGQRARTCSACRTRGGPMSPTARTCRCAACREARSRSSGAPRARSPRWPAGRGRPWDASR